MHFGMVVSSDELPDRSGTVVLAEHLERATAARAAGFRMIGVNQRYSVGPVEADERGAPLRTRRFQPLLLLGRLAAELGADMDSYVTHALVSPSLHPVQLAEDAATLDAICHGRLRLGLALGWAPYEFEAFGIPRGVRAERFEELLIVLRGLLAGEPVSFEGRHFSVRSSRMLARGVQTPHPPLWVGANTENAVRRAARLGDTWLISSHNTIAELEELIPVYKEARAAAGLAQPASLPMTRIVFVAPDRDTALRVAEPQIAEWYRRRGSWGWSVTKDADMVDEVMRAGRWIIGDPDDCVRQLQALRDRLGASEVMLAMPRDSVDHATRMANIRLLGAEVLPALTS